MKKRPVNRFVLRHDGKEFRLSLFHIPSKNAKPILVDRLSMEPEVALMMMLAFRRNISEFEAVWGRIKPYIKEGRFSEDFKMLVETRGD